MASFLGTLQRIGRLHSTFKLFRENPAFPLIRRSSKKSENRFGQSMILLQDGLNIQELPIIVKRTNDVTTICQNVAEASSESPNCEEPESFLFKNLKTFEDIFKALGMMKTEDVTPAIALQAFKRIGELGQFSEYRNQGMNRNLFSLNVEEKSFTFEAVLVTLIQLVCRSSSKNIIEAFKIFCLPSFPASITDYREMIAEECLQRIFDGKLSVLEVCELIQAFAVFSNGSKARQWADQSWVGIVQRKSEEINENNIYECFQALPCLKDSRRAVFNVLERRFLSCIYKVPVNQVVDILEIIRQLKLSSRVICQQTCRWLSVVLHTVEEESVTKLSEIFKSLEFYDEIFLRTLERYLKARNSHTVSQELISSVSDYCLSFRVRSTSIFNAIADQFVKSEKVLNSRTVESVVTAFGILNFQPQNEFEFWSSVEEVLDKKFITFKPESIIDICLSCLYLQRFPVNFIPRIFSTHFLERLQSVQNEEQLRIFRSKLRLLDAGMSLECSQYPNRLLPRDYSAKSISRDGRVQKMCHTLVQPLEKLVGPQMAVSPSIVLADLPLHELYIADILVSSASEPVYHHYGLNRPGKGAIVILVHPAEHFTLGKTTLLGPQIMRCRQLLTMGFRVVNLDLDVLLKYKDNPEVLEKIFKVKFANLGVPT